VKTIRATRKWPSRAKGSTEDEHSYMLRSLRDSIFGWPVGVVARLDVDKSYMRVFEAVLAARRGFAYMRATHLHG